MTSVRYSNFIDFHGQIPKSVFVINHRGTYTFINRRTVGFIIYIYYCVDKSLVTVFRTVYDIKVFCNTSLIASSNFCSAKTVSSTVEFRLHIYIQTNFVSIYTIYIYINTRDTRVSLINNV